MGLRNLELTRFTPPLGASFGHKHFWERAISRRTFIAGAAAGVGGTALLAGFPLTASAKGTPGAPRPVPGSVDVAGSHFHVNLPGSGDQSTVFDFNGLIAASDTGGAGKGEFGDLTFDADMRIMEGEYIDVAGRNQHAAFGFIWLDVFEGPAAPDFSNQVHDFDPGFGDGGLFWTVAIPRGAAHIEPGAGKATFRMQDLPITDYGSIPNGLFHFAPPTPGRVSFDIEWSRVTSRSKVRNPDPMQRFGGEFATTQTHVAWRGWNGDTLVFESSDDGQTTNFSQVGHEFNGAFFPGWVINWARLGAADAPSRLESQPALLRGKG